MVSKKKYQMLNRHSSSLAREYGVSLRSQSKKLAIIHILLNFSVELEPNIEISDNFKYWLIGFTESDGIFGVTPSGYLRFRIQQSDLDIAVLEYIKKKLGFGSVRRQSKASSLYVFQASDRHNILKLIHIFNGNLVTPDRIVGFEKWVKNLNKELNFCRIITNQT